MHTIEAQVARCVCSALCAVVSFVYIQGYRRGATRHTRLTNCLCLSPAIFSPGYYFAERDRPNERTNERTSKRVSKQASERTNEVNERSRESRRGAAATRQHQQPARNITAAFPWRIYPVPCYEISRTIALAVLPWDRRWALRPSLMAARCIVTSRSLTITCSGSTAIWKNRGSLSSSPRGNRARLWY